MKWYQVEISLYHDTLAKSGFLTVGMCKYKNIFLLFFQSFLSSTIAGHKVCHCRRRRRQASSHLNRRRRRVLSVLQRRYGGADEVRRRRVRLLHSRVVVDG